MNLQSFLPTDYNKTMKAEVAGLVKKWEKTGLLEGLNEKTQERQNVARLLENQAKQLVLEASRTGTDSRSEEWAGVALPLVRRIFTEIVAKDFVSVQPMNLPTGLVFFLDFKYGTAQSGFTTGSGRTSQADSVFGVTDARKGTAGTGGLYGAGRFPYSINDVTTATMTTGSVASGSISSSAANFTSDINYNTVVSASLATTTLKKITIATASLSGFDVEAIRGFSISGSTITASYPEFTKLNSSGHIEMVVASTSDNPNAVVTYTKAPGQTSRGDFEAGQASATFDTALDIPEINLELRSEEINAKTRRLKTKWSEEFAQDLNAYQSLDAEAELTSMLSEYISHEIDLEILDMLMVNAQTTEYWSARNNTVWNGSAFVAATSGFYNAQGQWFQTLGTKLQKVSNEIHRLNLRGGANFLVCSPTVSTILESIPGYAADTDGTKTQYAMGVQKIGTMNSRFTVYKNPYMTENVILMGYRGSQFLETGAVYAPYIPIMMTPTVIDPTNFQPRKGILTRYGKKILRPEFYGKIYVEGLDTI